MDALGDITKGWHAALQGLTHAFCMEKGWLSGVNQDLTTVSISTNAKHKPETPSVASPHSLQKVFPSPGIIVAYDNNQIVRNVKCVGLAASRGQRGVCETNNKQPHAVWVLPWLNDIFPLGLSCFTSAADQTFLLPFFFFSRTTKHKRWHWFKRRSQPQKQRSRLSLRRYFQTWLSP